MSWPRYIRGQEETVSDQHQARAATLVVGATGDLGRVVRELLPSRKPVRALVRDESNPSALIARGVEVVRGAHDYWARDLKKGRLTALGKAEVPVSSVHIDDVARYLARAVEEPHALGRRIDIGMDRALSFKDLAEIFSRLLDQPIKLRTIPWTPVNTAMALGGVLSPRIRDFRAMLGFFASGQSVADTAQQAEFFGSVPTAEETLHRYVREAGLRAP